MSDPLAEALIRLTPVAPNLDRDALMFAAGRTSVKPPRGWILVSGLLVATQLLTLVILWPHSPPVPTSSPTIPRKRILPLESPTLESDELWSAQRHVLANPDAASIVVPPDRVPAEETPTRAADLHSVLLSN